MLTPVVVGLPSSPAPLPYAHNKAPHLEGSAHVPDHDATMPFCPPTQEAIPYHHFGDTLGNPNLVLATTPTGGHLGWITDAQTLWGGPWTDAVALEFVQAALRQAPRPSDQAASAAAAQRVAAVVS